MKTTLRTVTILAILPLLASPALAAINDMEDDWEYNETATTATTARSSREVPSLTKAYRRASAAEVFYGSDESDNDVDIWGATFRETVCWEDTSVQGTPVLPECFAILRVGAGEESWAYGEYESTATMFLVTLGVGGGFRAEISSYFSVFVRGEIAVAFEHVEYDRDCDGWHDYASSDTDVGLLLGVGVGVQLNIGDHSGVFVAVDWLKTSCDAFKRLGADKLEYTTYSIGYVWSF